MPRSGLFEQNEGVKEHVVEKLGKLVLNSDKGLSCVAELNNAILGFLAEVLHRMYSGIWVKRKPESAAYRA